MTKYLRYLCFISILIAPLLLLLPFKPSPFIARRNQRRIKAYAIKSSVAHFDKTKPMPLQPYNNDEQLYMDKHGNYNKALRHVPSGFPDPIAYASMVHALQTENGFDFDAIILGGARHLTNPQASLAFDLNSNDSWINAIPAAPSFESAQAAGEMVENYWAALLRDVPFNNFDTHTIAMQAIKDLNTLSDFRGPKIDDIVTSTTLLRGTAPGEMEGPHISQFLYQSIPLGAIIVAQTFPQPTQNSDFITTIADWLTVANGHSTDDSITYGPSSFIRNARDLTEYVHKDTPCMVGITTALILNSFGNNLDPANPYVDNPTQNGLVTFGSVELLALLEEASHAAIKTAYYQKWHVHRRVRPEEFGFYLHQQKTDNRMLNIHPNLLHSAALPLIFNSTGTYLLPQAYPEGAPTHPSYPASHAAFIGAAVTILKAWFNEDSLIPSPVMPNADNTELVPYPETLTVGQELNKLASNIALGRDHAGVHYRSDSWEGMLLGEQVAIDILNNRSFLFNEKFEGFNFTTFEGKKITVGAKN